MSRRNILDILKERPILGDGGYTTTLERRGFVTAGTWTPEASIEHPEAVKQLHREFQRAGSDVLQALTFFSSDGRLEFADHRAHTSEDLNRKACEIVWEVARTSDTLVCGALSPTPTFIQGKGEAAVKAEFRKQCDIYVKNKLDFLLAEFIGHIQEAEWAIQVMKEYQLPVGCSMRIGPTGDIDDVTAGDCAVRMARAGADIVGVNCNFDPHASLKTIKLMKERLDQEGLRPFLIAQPLGFHYPDIENVKNGYLVAPDCPLALESRLISRWDAANFAREAYDLGVRYIGGCCGFEPYHIRQMAEELSAERGFAAPGVDNCPPDCGALKKSVYSSTVNRASNEYWKTMAREMAEKRRRDYEHSKKMVDSKT